LCSNIVIRVGSLDRDSGKIKVRIVKKRLQGWVVTGICVFVRISRGSVL